MENKDRNWLNLFGNYTPKAVTWYSQTTVYSLDKKVLRTSKFTRSFKSNLENTMISHCNTYFLPDGSVKEKRWEIKKEDCTQEDGIVHPESQRMRALSFGQGNTAWLSRHIEPGENFGAELFFRHHDQRCSGIVLYNGEGKLDRFVTIREQLEDFPQDEPQPPLEEISGQWKGTRNIMTSDLNILPEEEVKNKTFDLKHGEYKTFTLPDSIIINVPEELPQGEGFKLMAGKLMSETHYKCLEVKYNASGTFESLTLEQLTKEN